MTEAPSTPPPNDRPLDAATRTAVLNQIADSLDRYAFPEVAAKIQADLRDRIANDGYSDLKSGLQFSETLTAQLQTLSKDLHLKVHFSPAPLPHLDADAEPTPEELEQQRQLSRLRNYDFNKIERLAGNIGYLQLFSFEPPEFAGDTAAAAMAFLAPTHALIIDIRHNRGGSPGMVALLCSYLLPDYPPVHLNDLYWAAEDRTQQWWTVPFVPGQRYLERPVYVLIGSETFSAAEEFAYNLQQLKRAVIVGETSGGGANPGRGIRLDDHFWMFLPTGQAINPITGSNWEGTGVVPDFKIPSELALQAAHLMGLKKLEDTVSSPTLQREVQEAIPMVSNRLDQMQQDLISQIGGLR
ncbi:MAG: S41 family peptidase [Cyanobacteria bacterium J06635_1]